MQDKVLRYFEDINLITEAFKYYANASEKERETLTFEDTVIKGFCSYLEVEEHSKVVTSLKKEIAKNNKLKHLIRTFATIFHRRELVTFFRETEKLDFIDYDALNEEEEWKETRDNILKSDKTISEEELAVLNTLESKRLLITICNFLTHNLKDKFLFESDTKPYINNKITKGTTLESYSKKLTRNTFKELYFESYTAIKFKSYRLNKTFNFKIDSNQMNSIVTAVSNSISQHIGLEDDICLDLSQVDEEKQNIISLDEREDAIVNYVYGDTHIPYKMDEHKRKAIKNMFKTYFAPLSKEMMKYLYEEEFVRNNSDEEILLKFELFKNMALLENNISFLRIFNKGASYFSIYESLALFLIAQENFKDININTYRKTSLNRAITAQKEMLKISRFEGFNDPWAINSINQTSLFALLPEQIYREVLLTQILNLLEYLDSQQTGEQELWKDLEETYQVFEDIQDKYSLTDWTSKNIKSIPGTIRNAIQHDRYIKDINEFYFYDGVETIDFKFATTIQELEEIKESCLEYVQDYIKNLTDGVTA